MPGAYEEKGTTADFWDLPLNANDRGLLDEAFERDGELREETAAMFSRLLELDLRDTFVRALVSRLAASTGSHHRCGP